MGFLPRGLLPGSTEKTTVIDRSSQQQSREKNQKDFVIHPLLRHLHFDSDTLFSLMLMNHPNPTKSDYVLEVGCFSLKQSTFSSIMGFSTISFDPSPRNFRRMKENYRDLPQVQQERITLVNLAVSSVSGNKLSFSTSGGTGDHVAGVSLDQREQRPDAGIHSVEVETVALDDAIDNVFEKDENANIFMIKIDVQGHEASVLKGLSRHLQKVRYILLEYWVDALDQAAGHDMGTCSGVSDVLEVLYKANFELYDLSTQSHPDGDYEGGPRSAYASDYFRPTDPYEHCRWFHNAGIKGRQQHNYQMGYWTDILAIQRKDYTSNEMGNLKLRGRRPVSGVVKKQNEVWKERMELRNVAAKMPLTTNDAAEETKA